MPAWDVKRLTFYLSQNVPGVVFEVSNSIRGVRVESQVPFFVGYKGGCVGEYFADLLVEGALLVQRPRVEYRRIVLDF